ncbi:bi-domain-containing oxidoreductase [Bauldia litoralis]|uniref:Threonine dehydrogenase n=1 Tax=Bauldia litoralis TaxID=665467 RepID=A0A1G6CVC6_9HYPH|nr:bi-domain-containing oxidoreductase [Bauldia litoralis]SDB36794.1 Threonine dehydrogenase [Bauldia litoralis]
MKAVVQSFGAGKTELVDLPAPQVLPGTAIIVSRRSLISSGTERMLVNFGRGSMLDKARQRPDKVRQVLDKVRTDGVVATVEAVRRQLDQPITLGYSNAGVVVEVGNDVTSFKPGDRVVSNGPHAGMVRVPVNLCAPIPENVDDDAACFAVVGAVALQGVRLVAPTLGETVVVIGLGLIGLITIQILRANGCRVLGVDLDAHRLDLAKTLGADVFNASHGGDAVAKALWLTGGQGADAVIIATAASSNAPFADAAKMCRPRGKIVLVGTSGLAIKRDEFWKKELTFAVSRAYGPTDLGHSEDYPPGLVRWSSKRNFEAVLGLIETGGLDTRSLISHAFDFDDAVTAYDTLVGPASTLGIVLRYPALPAEEAAKRRIAFSDSTPVHDPRAPSLGWIGAGNYASRKLLQAFKAAGAQLHTLVTTGGTTGILHGRSAGFSVASSDVASVLTNDDIGAIVIATRHDTHATFVIDALGSGRHVFVEKPLALDLDDVDRIETAWRTAAKAGAPCLLTVGFNRRFAPLVKRVKQLLERASEPTAFIYTCNAGALPAGHWTLSSDIGGGRIIGEACHFIDLLRHLAGAPILETQVMPLALQRGGNPDDGAVISLRFENRSVGTIQYLPNGSSRFPKERLEVFNGGGVLVLDNYKTLRGYGWPGFARARSWRQDKGQNACAAAFVAAVRDGTAPPIPVDEIFEVARVVIHAGAAIRSRQGPLM